MKADSALPGMLSLLGLAVLILIVSTCTSGCAEYPITISVHSDYGKASYSAKGGLELIIEK